MTVADPLSADLMMMMSFTFSRVVMYGLGCDFQYVSLQLHLRKCQGPVLC